MSPQLPLPHAKDNSQTIRGPVGSHRSVVRWVSLVVLALFVLIVLVLLAADILYLVLHPPQGGFWHALSLPGFAGAIRLSILTSLTTLVLVMLFAVPIGYALSRFRFPGHALVNTIVDIPIVLPPVVIGLSLLALFGTPLGSWIREGLKTGGFTLVSGAGIVLCQFLVSISYAIRAMKASFDAVDRRLEHVALSLGCSQWGAFWRVALPLSGGGVIAGGVMAWARAIGVFGPLMVFVGTSPRVQVMPTAMWLELSIGNVEVSLAVALVSVAMAGAALAMVHWLAPGRKWS